MFGCMVTPVYGSYQNPLAHDAGVQQLSLDY